MGFAAGTRIGQYSVLALLGAGGMGEVYLADDVRLRRKVALKVITTRAAGENEIAVQRFLREARAAAALDHPGICTVYEVGADDGVEYLAMQYLQGETLAERMARSHDRPVQPGPTAGSDDRALPLAEALRIAIDLGDALAYAHDRGILHRDLKPHNVMLLGDGRVKLLDFGLAKVSGDPAMAADAQTEAALTRQGTLLGTPEYMSPEQMSGRTADARSDTFSFALIVYELVGGRHPFRSHTAALTMSAILTRDYPPLRLPEPAGAALNAALARALARDPAHRHATAADFVADLRHAQRLFNDAGDPLAQAARTRAWRGPMAAAFAVAVAGIALAAAMPYIRSRRVERAGVSAPAPVATRTFSYWLDVQPMSGGRLADPIRSLGDESLSAGSKFRVNVTSSAPGVLYLLDDDPTEGAGGALSLIYPIAADQPASTDRRTPATGAVTDWYVFSRRSGTERMWMLWSAEPRPELDGLRALVNPRDMGRIPADRAAEVRQLLRDGERRRSASVRAEQPLQMTTDFSGPMMAYAIVLRHAERSDR
jgi:hypothetical protein